MSTKSPRADALRHSHNYRLGADYDEMFDLAQQLKTELQAKGAALEAAQEALESAVDWAHPLNRPIGIELPIWNSNAHAAINLIRTATTSKDTSGAPTGGRE